MSKKVDRKYQVIVDTREQHPWDFSDDQYCEGSVVKGLKTGDYSLVGFEDVLCIERKASTSEIAQNLIDDAFERELIRTQAYKERVIICEFDFSDIIHYPNINSGIPQRLWKSIRISPKFLLKKIVEYQTKYKIPFIFAGAYGQEMAIAYFKRVFYGIT